MFKIQKITFMTSLIRGVFWKTQKIQVKLVYLLLLSGIFIFPSFAKKTQPKTKKAQHEIIVQGWSLNSQNPQLLRQLKRFFKNKEFSVSALQQFLFKKDYYMAELIQNNKNITIEQAYQLIFIIKGNQFVSEEDIQKLLKENKKIGSAFYSLIERNLKTFYQEKAFLNVKIEKKERQRAWQKWITIRIEEGERTKLKGIEIKGLFSRPASYYEGVILDSSPDIKNRVFNKKSLQSAYQNLINILKSEGYLQSRIFFDRIFFKDNEAFAIIHLDEGPLIFITDIQIKGNKVFADWELLSDMKSKVQSTLKWDLLKQDLQTIQRLYKERGYYQVRIRNKKNIVKYKPGEEGIYLFIEIEEGEKFLVSDISLRGLKRVKKELVQSLLKIKINSPLTDEKKEKTIQALAGTGLFANVSINENIVQDRLEIDILFQERKPQSLKFRSGLNSERGLTGRIYTEWTHRNLFGWGRAFILRGDSQLIFLEPQKLFFEYDFSGRYKEIFAPGYDYEGDMNISQSRSIFRYFVEEGSRKINYVNKTLLSFFVNKNFFLEQLKLRWTVLSFENRFEACTYAGCPSNPQQITNTSFKISWDKRDHIFSPKNGYLISFITEWAPYFSQNIAFLKADMNSYWYRSFFQDYTLGFVFKSGYITTVQGSNYLPVSRAFILGGQNSIRAYDGNIEGKRIPRKKFTPIKTANEAFKLKTDSGLEENILNSQYNLFRLNFRFPLLNNFQGLVFYDFGSVFLQSANNRKLDYGHCVGLGLRYKFFSIPVGVDIAQQLPPLEECLGADNTPLESCSYSRFHFAIGR